MTPRGDLDIVKAGLIERIETLCAQLLPDGKVEGGQWVAWNPVENDRKPGRAPALKVRVRGGDVGAWKDWRCGESGDVLRLVAYLVTRGDARDTKAALAFGRDFLGIRAMTREEREALRQAEQKKRAERDRKADRWRRHRLDSAAELFMAGPTGDRLGREIGPALVPFGTFAFGQGSPAERHALAYLAARGVDLAALPNVNRESFRFSPATEWWRGATWREQDGRKVKVAPGPLYPAIHSAMRNALGHVTACHVTFLDPVMPAKAPVAVAKLIWGEAKGAVVEISTGPSGEPFWLADGLGLAGDPLILGEGIETAGSFCAPVPEARCWAGGSLAGVMHAPVGLDCVEWVLFARDNNTGNASAQKQFEAALAGLEAHGKRVVVEASHVGDDFNDLAQGVE